MYEVENFNGSFSDFVVASHLANLVMVESKGIVEPLNYPGDPPVMKMTPLLSTTITAFTTKILSWNIKEKGNKYSDEKVILALARHGIHAYKGKITQQLIEELEELDNL